MKKLPIGFSSLEKMRKDNYIYVDKTRHVANLVNNGVYYFLSRPRRFGKSLFVDTLKQAFLGNKELFAGLYLESNWDWSQKYPVLHFDFGLNASYESESILLEIIQSTIRNYAIQYQIELTSINLGLQFNELMNKMVAKCGQQIVVLIDEYDKPILDVIDDLEQAGRNREILKSLYAIIKTQDANLKFVLLTGVSKFSKVSLFSGLNNLDDITLDTKYADICGYTQLELEREFADYLLDGKVDKVKLKRWYNGYSFAGSVDQKVYNPFDVLLFCSKNYEYKSYWFETATPTFLIKMLQKNGYFIPDLENVRIMEESLSSFDVDNINITTLLFQTGYLTIVERVKIGEQFAYRLSYPNQEVKASLNSYMAQIGSNMEHKNLNIGSLYDCLLVNNFNGLERVFTSYFASIPHDWYRNNTIGQYEGFYASIVYSYFCALGYDVIAEDTTNHGKIDMTVKMPDKIIILEFKLSKYGDALDAICQIKEKNYPQKYVSENKPIHLIGASFDVESKNIADFAWEEFVL